MDPVKQQPQPKGLGQRVMVVDDDPALTRHANLVLSAFGMEVIEASGGERALEIIAREDIDAVLLDLHMPGMDGFETCRRIREMRRGDFLQIMVISGLDNPKAVESAYQAGATDFVLKPIDWQVLKHRIRYTINARAMAEEAAASNARRQRLLHNARYEVLGLDRNGRVVEARPSGDPRGRRKPLFKVGRPLIEALPADAADRARQAVTAVRNGADRASFEFDHRTTVGSSAYEVHLAPAGRGEIVALVRDLAEYSEREEQVRRLAYFDAVTGLPNREMLHRQVQEKLDAGAGLSGEFALMRLDLCGLEYTRSLLGNGLANRLVCAFARRLEALAKQGGEKPGRVGRVSDAGFAVVGDHFENLGAIESLAGRLFDGMGGSYTLDDYEVNVTTRIGVAISKRDEQLNADTLFDRAEMAVGSSKSAPAYYSSSTSQRRLQRARLMQDMQSAIDNGDMYLEYQPKVDATDCSLTGLEALLRWNHPMRGVVWPGEFIPLAEESGLILPLGEYVLHEACRQSREWTESGRRPLPIAVNFSGHQFSKKDLVKGLTATLSQHGISSRQIEIELTETVAMDRCLGFTGVMQELREIGVRTAIDDFGTGYSSLGNLRQFEFHTLKIDRSFVADLGKNPSAGSIIRGIISMSHALGLQVVAEGVEEQHQLDYLRAQGCDQIQGYLTGRPMGNTDILAMLPMA